MISCSLFENERKSTVFSGYVFRPKREKPLYEGFRKISLKVFDRPVTQLTIIPSQVMRKLDQNLDGIRVALIFNHYSHPLFFKITKNLDLEPIQSFLPPEFKTSFIHFIDLNGDGFEDLFSYTFHQRGENEDLFQIFLNQKNQSFKRCHQCTQQMNDFATTSVQFADWNRDGSIDIITNNWIYQDKQKAIIQPNRIYLNKGEGIFKESKAIEARPTFSSILCDVNQDQNFELFMSSTHNMGNQLLIAPQSSDPMKIKENLLDQFQFFFKNTQAVAMTDHTSTFGLACNDLNKDGVADLIVGEKTDSFEQKVLAPGLIYFSRPKGDQLPTPLFVSTDDLNAKHIFYHFLIQDYNLDGVKDLLVNDFGFPPHSGLRFFLASQQMNQLSYKNLCDEYAHFNQNPSATIYFDVNKDAKVDILTAQSHVRNKLLKNELMILINQHHGKSDDVQMSIEWAADIAAFVEHSRWTFPKLSKESYHMVSLNGGLGSQSQKISFFTLSKKVKKTTLELNWFTSKEVSRNLPQRLLVNPQKVKRYRLHLKPPHLRVLEYRDSSIRL